MKKTIAEITSVGCETDAEHRWAERMGSDLRRAWETAPTLGPMCMLASHLATRERFQAFVAVLFEVAGGDPAHFEVLSLALRTGAPPGHAAALAALRTLPGLIRPERELCDGIRARVSYESLTGGWS